MQRGFSKYISIVYNMSSSTYTIDDVKQWFSPLNVLDNQVVKNHLEFLQTYRNNHVTSWTRLFADCLRDIMDITPLKGENESGTLQRYKANFKTKYELSSNKDINNLNNMKKKEFVELFAKIMNEIINEEKQQQESEDELSRDRERQEVDSYNNGRGRLRGGSKKKSRKRATTRIRRRSRSRRASTRKYKK